MKKIVAVRGSQRRRGKEQGTNLSPPSCPLSGDEHWAKVKSPLAEPLHFFARPESVPLAKKKKLEIG